MRKKKEIPLIILQAIEPYFKEKSELFNLTEPEESLLKIVDADIESDFFFEIRDCKHQNNRISVSLKMKPKSNSQTDIFNIDIEYKQINDYFQRWKKILEDYSKTIYQDPIVKINQERFFEKYDILDEDADYATFDLEQQIYLDEYLSKTQDKILKLKKGKSEKEKAELDDLSKDAEKIKEVITKESKRKIIKRLSKFWGKAQKIGLPIIKEILINFSTELAKKLLLGG